MMLARDVQRLHAVLGLQDVVAMGVQQVVEELHVELIVLHDQNGLGFRVHGSGLSGAASPAPSTRVQKGLWPFWPVLGIIS